MRLARRPLGPAACIRPGDGDVNVACTARAWLDDEWSLRYWKGARMPRGDKSAYTDKQKRKAEHIEDGYKRRGVGSREAERRAWATVNRQDGGGKKAGSGRRRGTKSSSRHRRKEAGR
jgi:plasmid stabilization system protein ParE